MHHFERSSLELGVRGACDAKDLSGPLTTLGERRWVNHGLADNRRCFHVNEEEMCVDGAWSGLASGRDGKDIRLRIERSSRAPIISRV